MTIIPDLGQAHETCGEVKLVKVPNPPPMSCQLKMEKTKAATYEPYKIKQKVNQSN